MEITSSTRAAVWFDQDLFAGVESEKEEDTALNKMMYEHESKKRKHDTVSDQNGDETPDTKKRKLENNETTTQGKESDHNNKSDGNKSEQSPKSKPSNGHKTEDEEDEEGNKKKSKRKEEVFDFDVVPLEKFDSDDMDMDDNEGVGDDASDYDSDERAEMLSMGSMMKDPQGRARVIEHTISKYMFNDSGTSLPEWFKDDEEKHIKPIKPVTKEMVAEYKQDLKAINARATHKVVEAKARKKKRFTQKLEKARAKAKVIADNSDLSERDKIRTIQKLYKGNLHNVKPNKVYVVAKKFQNRKLPRGNVRMKVVDPRLKKDKRLSAGTSKRVADRKQRRNKKRS